MGDAVEACDEETSARVVVAHRPPSPPRSLPLLRLSLRILRIEDRSSCNQHIQLKYFLLDISIRQTSFNVFLKLLIGVVERGEVSKLRSLLSLEIFNALTKFFKALTKLIASLRSFRKCVLI